jgi:hypothetical protein
MRAGIVLNDASPFETQLLGGSAIGRQSSHSQFQRPVTKASHHGNEIVIIQWHPEHVIVGDY